MSKTQEQKKFFDFNTNQFLGIRNFCLNCRYISILFMTCLIVWKAYWTLKTTPESCPGNKKNGLRNEVGHVGLIHARPRRRKDQLLLRDRSPFPLNSNSFSTLLSKKGTQMAPGGRGALEETGTYLRHVLYFKLFYTGQTFPMWNFRSYSSQRERGKSFPASDKISTNQR